jgi:hypothetical protein
MRAAVERHVLEEMCEPALIIRLVQRSRAHEQAQRGACLRFMIRHDRIAQSIWQLPKAHRGVGFEVARLVREWRGCLLRRWAFRDQGRGEEGEAGETEKELGHQWDE